MGPAPANATLHEHAARDAAPTLGSGSGGECKRTHAETVFAGEADVGAAAAAAAAAAAGQVETESERSK
jgi:hypothetical protein